MKTNTPLKEKVTVKLSKDKKNFLLKTPYGEYKAPNTELSFPASVGCCKDDNYCEKCENNNIYATPVNMLLLHSAAKEAYTISEEDDSFLVDYLPPIARNMDEKFYANFRECFANVAKSIEDGKLPEPTCTAEEIALNIVVTIASQRAESGDFYGWDLEITQLLPETDYDYDITELHYSLVQDIDIMFLYDMSFDGIEDNPNLGIVNLKPSEWFEKF